MRLDIPASERLIVALDVDTPSQAAELVQALGDSVSFYKVGLQLFMRPGMSVVDQLVEKGKKVFLDLKVDDTPRTVTEAVRRAAVDGVELFTLQGNAETARAALAGRGARSRPQFLQVTFLSSWDDASFQRHFGLAAASAPSIDEAIVTRTRTILEAGCEGVIASGQSVARIREAYGDDVLIVTPGIRPSGAADDDHKRSLTPRAAMLAGADYLVVGRPIRNAERPTEQARAIVLEIEAALAETEPASAAGRRGR